ncbi:hypothetical protein GF325_01840 [Candidatus Bathyarchaeota archaeon]|nr:hypothetical protein [Candidatus Bathyarchaeota archaeon]
MEWDLKKIGMTLVIGFFMVSLIVTYITPFKVFVASTSPDRLPFKLSTVHSLSVTSLEKDHVVISYIEDDAIYYKESDMRGYRWRQSHELLDNLEDPGNLTVNSISTGSGLILALAWDELEVASNESTRKAFFALIDPNSKEVLYGPSRCSEAGNETVEFNPSLTGTNDAGFCMTWVTNGTGNQSIGYRFGDAIDAMDLESTLNVSTGKVDYPSILITNDDAYKLIYKEMDDARDRVMMVDLHRNGTVSSSQAVLDPVPHNKTIEFLDASLDSRNDLILSLQFSNTMNSTSENESIIYWMSSAENYSEEGSLFIANHTDLHDLQHVIFANDQVLTLWLEPAGSLNEPFFIITDFDMTNKNSIIHNVLIAYIFFSCGIFTMFVSKKVCKKRDGQYSRLNNLIVSILFWVLAFIFLLPYSGFYGEKLGQSYADGYVLPAPINLSILIVIGFVFLFFLMSTPLIDKFWHSKQREKDQDLIVKQEGNSHSLKQELLRKVPHMISSIFIAGFVPLGTWAMQVTALQKYDRYNFINEGAIIFDYVLQLNDIEIGSYAVKLCLASGIIFLWLLDLHILLIPSRYFVFKDFLRYTLREKEKNAIADFVTMFFSMLLMVVILTFNPQYKLIGSFCVFAGFSTLCFGDTVGAIVGKKYGRREIGWGNNKTWEGALSGTITSILLSLVFISWPFALIVGVCYLFVDLITPKVPISDNVLIPIVISLVLLPFLPWITSPLLPFFT